MKSIKELLYLVDAFKSLPNIGNKTATKLAIFLLEQDSHYQHEFLKRISQAISNLKKCKYCNDITDSEICESCRDKKINKSLCIVNSYEDLLRIDDSNNYNGYYHNLSVQITNNKIDLKKIDIDKLINQIKDLEINEIILAMPFSLVGEMIANYLFEQLKNINDNIYRIGFGIPLNASIDYIDDETIRESLINKKKIQ